MDYQSQLKVLSADSLPPLPNHLEDFLAMLGGPTAIKISGTQSRHCRVVCTLLHGNEPSGAWAIHQWLSRLQDRDIHSPHTPLLFILANIQAALLPPVFTHRQVPNYKDLNRCFFQTPATTPEYRLAQSILTLIKQHEPEAIVDLHNTSGPGPSFAITTRLDAPHQALASVFTHQLILTRLKLGALMEFGEQLTPTITVECGGAQEMRSARMALAGLERFVTAKAPLSQTPQTPLNIYDNPLRLCLKDGGKLAYGNPIDHQGADLVLPHQIAHFNEAPTLAGAQIGHLGDKGIDGLTAIDNLGQEQVKAFFTQSPARTLVAKTDLQLFMATHRADIALSDCLFYFAPLAQNNL